MAGERFPDPSWPELPGAVFRSSGAARQICGTRAQCLDWARSVWRSAVDAGNGAAEAWFHLITDERGWNDVQGFIHSQFVREAVGIDALVEAARALPRIMKPSPPPHIIDDEHAAALRAAARWQLPLIQLEAVDSAAFSAALEAARGRRAYRADRFRGPAVSGVPNSPSNAMFYGSSDVVDDYWISGRACGAGIDAGGHIWASTYGGEEWVDLTALAEQPVILPIPEPTDEQTMAEVCLRLNIPRPGSNLLYRHPDGALYVHSADRCVAVTTPTTNS
ncbi:MAG TPA: hypothetical protein VGS58_05065 [Candidatus Sulfopaludibacter sp.]|nr:hypothetical protein [Candidatus Sulfopaludibacter sp.]